MAARKSDGKKAEESLLRGLVGLPSPSLDRLLARVFSERSHQGIKAVKDKDEDDDEDEDEDEDDAISSEDVPLKKPSGVIATPAAVKAKPAADVKAKPAAVEKEAKPVKVVKKNVIKETKPAKVAKHGIVANEWTREQVVARSPSSGSKSFKFAEYGGQAVAYKKAKKWLKENP